jgi:hypothetical protein
VDPVLFPYISQLVLSALVFAGTLKDDADVWGRVVSGAARKGLSDYRCRSSRPGCSASQSQQLYAVC